MISFFKNLMRRNNKIVPLPLPQLKDTILYDLILELEERPKVPPCLAINIHTYCNARCDMCTTTYERGSFNHGIMDWELYTKIVDEYKDIGGQVITFCQHGDTFAHKTSVDYIRYVVSKGLKCYIVTNAGNLTPEIVDELVSFGFKGPLVVSFHGIRKSTYEKTMGLNYKKTLMNINYAMKKMSISMIRSLGHNFEQGEKEEVLRYWNKRNLPVHFADTMDWAGTLKKEVGATKYNHKEIRGCIQVLNQLCVDYDGTVYLCCIDMLKQVTLGNLKDSNIIDVWNGKEFQKVISWIFNKEQCPDNFICKKCHAAIVY